MRIASLSDFVLDLLFPPACALCGELIVNAEGKNAVLCEKCREAFPYITDSETPGGNFTKNFAVADYADVRALIHAFKYGGDKRLARLLAELTLPRLPDYIAEADVLTSVPVSAKKLRTRGFNQAYLYAEELSKLCGIPASDVLIRSRDTKAQSGLSAKARRDNLKGSISVKSENAARETFLGKTVVIADDILTTGATMEECAEIVTLYGAKDVFGIADSRREAS